MDLNILKSQWDRTAAIVLTLAGVICLVAGYAGVADSVLLAEQTRFVVSGGIGGIFLLGLGATLWISADLRDEWRKLDRIERALADGVLRWSGESIGAGPAKRATAGSNRPAVNGSAPASQAGSLATSSREHA